MSFLTKTKADDRVKDVRCDEHALTVDLMDGRSISVPLAWYPRLLRATAAQRANWEILAGFIIHWPDIDEDLSTEGLLQGAPAPRGNASAPARSDRKRAGRRGRRRRIMA